MKKLPAISVLLILFLYLLAFPAQALESARSGLLLWYRSVLPVLFPFMLLSGILVRLGVLDRVMPTVSRPLRALFGCSPLGAYAVLTGFLCGFPMGAKTASDLYRQGRISRKEEEILCGFANNLSPSFILSFLAADQMQLPSLGGVFLFCILGSALLYGLFASRALRGGNRRDIAGSDAGTQRGITAASTAYRKDDAEPAAEPPASLEELFALVDGCIYDAVQNTVRLGAYIVMFSILSGAVLLLIPVAGPAGLLLASCVEVSGGIHLIAFSPFSPGTRCLLATALAAFGGLSALAQTVSVASMDRRMLFAYIKSRAAITLLAVLLCLGSLLFLRPLPLG